MLSNAYFLAKFRFDTAENKPAKNGKNSVFLNSKYFFQAVEEALRIVLLVFLILSSTIPDYY